MFDVKKRKRSKKNPALKSQGGGMNTGKMVNTSLEVNEHLDGLSPRAPGNACDSHGCLSRNVCLRWEVALWPLRTEPPRGGG
jgi:hypothetical protein